MGLSIHPSMESQSSSTKLVYPYLVLLDSGLPDSPEIGQRYELEREEILIGSDPKSDIQLAPTVASFHHARLYFREGQWYLQNLLPTNDVCIDQVVVGIHSFKRDGEAFSVGRAIFSFMFGEGPWSRYHEDAEKRSDTDPLLYISNQRAFEKSFRSSISILSRKGGSIGLIMFDVDGFKMYNTQYGHLGGNTILKELVRRVSSRVREEELFARWGGDEFVLLMPGANLGQAKTSAERIRQLIESPFFLVDGNQVNITISMGVASTDHEVELEEFTRIANKNLFLAKKNGKNCVVG